MTERPILFSGPMIRAILSGSKSQTRRVVKPPRGWPQFSHCDPFAMPPAVWWWNGEHARVGVKQDCPYGQPGDRLWVRETWGYRCSSSTSMAKQYMHTIAYRADDARFSFGPMPIDGVSLPQQRERQEDESYEAWMDYLTTYWAQWRPSIHMPRWASRITLEVEAVRVERLGEISESDAWAEGVQSVSEFKELWASINGTWEPKQWIWVLQFQRV